MWIFQPGDSIYWIGCRVATQEERSGMEMMKGFQAAVVINLLLEAPVNMVQGVMCAKCPFGR